MKRNLVYAVLLTAMLTVGANAGTISGKVAGVAGESVIYVDAVKGKTSRHLLSILC